MPTSGKVAQTISEVEGFDVSFVDEFGEPVDDAKVVQYDYSRAARNSWTVAQWRRKRVEPAYPDLWVAAWRPDGEEAHGRTQLETLRRLRTHDYVLSPSRYVGVAPPPEYGEPFAEKMTCLPAEWRAQQSEAAKLNAQIESSLQSLGF